MNLSSSTSTAYRKQLGHLHWQTSPSWLHDTVLPALNLRPTTTPSASTYQSLQTVSADPVTVAVAEFPFFIITHPSPSILFVTRSPFNCTVLWHSLADFFPVDFCDYDVGVYEPLLEMKLEAIQAAEFFSSPKIIELSIIEE